MTLRTFARSLLNSLPRRLLYEMFYQSGRALGVTAYQVDGSAGSFFGPMYDVTLIRTYLETGAWSENLVGLYRRFFAGENGGTLYDIGANIGLISLPIARIPNVRVVAFEPDPHNCALLRANAAYAGVDIEIVNAAVAEERGMLQFARSGYNSGDHHLATHGELSVASVPLSDYPPGPGSFAVKIDTQGAEPLIFRGGESVLATADLIVAEFWPWGMRRMHLTPDEILSFSARHFRHGLVVRHGQSIGTPEPIENVLDKLRHIVIAGGENDDADLILCRVPV